MASPLVISNTTYQLCKGGNSYILVPSDLNGNIFPKVTLDVDASDGDVEIYLPSIAVFNNSYNFELQITRTDNSVNYVKIFAYSDIDSEFIGAEQVIQLPTSYQSVILTPTTDISWSANTTLGNAPTFVIVNAIDQAYFADSKGVNLGTFTIMIVFDYNASGNGCTLIKKSTNNANFEDWIIMATDSVVDTGAIGDNPI